jgi:hypothetical protein
VKVVQATNYQTSVVNTHKTPKEWLTKLAALAETSRTEGNVDNTVSTEARSEEERREMSRRHSVARALNMDNEMRSELKTKVNWHVCWSRDG